MAYFLLAKERNKLTQLKGILGNRQCNIRTVFSEVTSFVGNPVYIDGKSAFTGWAT